jgi:hypothetical protein
MFKKIAVVFVLIIIAFSGFVSSRPDDFRISRSITIAAPADKIFEQVNSPQKMVVWSPWSKLDPNAKMTYSEIQEGVGAAYTWSGNNEVGEGTATIIESKPSELVKTRLDFVKPMQASNTAEFTIQQKGEQVEVTWAMYGKNNFIAKAVGIFIDCDKMVGGMFEQGLGNLKTLVEAK